MERVIKAIELIREAQKIHDSMEEKEKELFDLELEKLDKEIEENGTDKETK